jgi:hypothetical protein
MSRSWPRLLTRITAAVLAVQVLLQPVLAGGFLSGHYDLLRFHMINGFTMIVVSLVQTVAAVFLYRAGASREVLVHGFAVPLAIATTAVLGEFRILALHVPIGVLMAVGILRLASEAWQKDPRKQGQKDPRKQEQEEQRNQEVPA